MATRKCAIVNPKYTQLKDFMQELATRWDAGEGKVIYKGNPRWNRRKLPRKGNR